MINGAYILSFDSTSHAIGADKALADIFAITVIPTPREITQNCGLSIKINDNNLAEILKQIKDLAIPCTLYRLGGEKKAPRSLEIIFKLA